MKLTCMVSSYNDECIMPYFMEHYNDEVDHFIVYLDQDTNDKTVEILNKYPKVEIRPMVQPDGMDEGIRTAHFQEGYNGVKEGWVLVVDSDELFFAEEGTIKNFLETVESKGFNVARGHSPLIFRHKDDKDLDPTIKPIISQRKHGIWWDGDYKYCAIKAGMNVTIGIGQHSLGGAHNLSPYDLEGCHWACADESILYGRWANRNARRSEQNKRCGWGGHVTTASPERVPSLMEEHFNDEIYPYFLGKKR